MYITVLAESANTQKQIFFRHQFHSNSLTRLRHRRLLKKFGTPKNISFALPVARKHDGKHKASQPLHQRGVPPIPREEGLHFLFLLLVEMGINKELSPAFFFWCCFFGFYFVGHFASTICKICTFVAWGTKFEWERKLNSKFLPKFSLHLQPSTRKRFLNL